MSSVAAKPAPAAAAGAAGAKAGPDAAKATGAVASLSGVVKAALWLLSADEETAVATLQLLSPDEVKRIRQVAETMQKVSPQELARVHHEFKYILEQQPLRLRGSVSYLGKLATQAYGERAAAELLRLPQEQIPAHLILGEVDPQILTMNLMEEHPQIIAAVFSSLEPTRVSNLLARFSDSLRDEVLMRLAKLKKVPTESLERAQKYLSAMMPPLGSIDSNVDGVRMTATVLNEAGKEEAERALGVLAQGGEALSSTVRDAMFTFEDLQRLDKRGVQTLLKDVAADRLLLALKTATDEFKDKIFAGMSMRAAEMMREDLLAMGPTKLADVEAAKKDVVTVALKLRDEGKITVGGGQGLV